MFYIWYYDNDDISTHYYLAKGSETDIYGLWDSITNMCDEYVESLESSGGLKCFEVAKAYGEIMFWFSPPVTQYCFVIEYIGDNT